MTSQEDSTGVVTAPCKFRNSELLFSTSFSLMLVSVLLFLFKVIESALKNFFSPSIRTFPVLLPSFYFDDFD